MWLRTDGHNIFLYHHPTQPGAPILCDSGVEVTRTFESAGEVYATETQGGEAAVAVHRGPRIFFYRTRQKDETCCRLGRVTYRDQLVLSKTDLLL